MQKIYIRTHAYNAEKTLNRAVDSVLNQTYSNFSYYLCDNGSTDGGATRRIVEEYSRLDNRVVPFFNKVNKVWDGNEGYLEITHNINDDEYYCVLDADDEYLPTFFEEMIAFMNEYNLDIACCGSDFNSVAHNNKLVSQRLLNRNLILEGQELADLFPVYHMFMRTVWGKLFRGNTLPSIVTRHEDDPNYPVAYGGDTYVTMRALRDAKRVGILARSLHKYYISPASVSHIMHPQRVRCDQILHEDAIDYLKFFGEISRQNWDFLYVIYMNALRDTLSVLLKAEIPVLEKLKWLVEMLGSEYTFTLAAMENFGLYIGQAKNIQYSRKEFFMTAAYWLLELEEVPDEQAEAFCDTGEFACAASEFSDGWMIFKKLPVSFLIDKKRVDEALEKVKELEELLPGDEEVLGFRMRLNELEDIKFTDVGE